MALREPPFKTCTLGDESFGGSDYKMLSDLLSFSRPDDMRQIHINYYKAGSHAVETNTFGATPMRLSEYDFSAIDLAHFAPIPYDEMDFSGQ